MAHVNQGVFKKIIDNYNALCEEYRVFMDINPDFFDFTEGYSSNADNIYTECEKLISEINNMFNTIKFDSSKEEKYKDMLVDLESKHSEVLYKYKDIYDKVKDNLSDMDIRTIDKMNIYNQVK